MSQSYYNKINEPDTIIETETQKRLEELKMESEKDENNRTIVPQGDNTINTITLIRTENAQNQKL